MSNDTYFAAVKLNTMLAMVKDGTRDLTSVDLKPYWDGMLDEPMTERYAESAEFRAKNDLPSLGASQFAAQASRSSGQQTFIQYLNEVGVESVYVEDVSKEDMGATIPDLGVLGEVIQRLQAKGYTADPEALSARYAGVVLPSDPQTVLHLDEPLPSTWADEDGLIAARLARARAYLFSYLGGI
jgi:hypothetical protein